MKAGAIDVLPKPVREQDLLEAVSRALAHDQQRRTDTTRDQALRMRSDTLSALYTDRVQPSPNLTLDNFVSGESTWPRSKSPAASARMSPASPSSSADTRRRRSFALGGSSPLAGQACARPCRRRPWRSPLDQGRGGARKAEPELFFPLLSPGLMSHFWQVRRPAQHRTSSSSLCHIAPACGFSDQAHFTRTLAA